MLLGFILYSFILLGSQSIGIHAWVQLLEVRIGITVCIRHIILRKWVQLWVLLSNLNHILAVDLHRWISRECKLLEVQWCLLQSFARVSTILNHWDIFLSELRKIIKFNIKWIAWLIALDSKTAEDFSRLGHLWGNSTWSHSFQKFLRNDETFLS